jgi:hypothetical protein
MAGGGLPNTKLPSSVTQTGIREIQLAQFLENLEVDFFTKGSANITGWGTTGYSNDSAEIVGKIAAVGIISKPLRLNTNIHIARESPSRKPHYPS